MKKIAFFGGTFDPVHTGHLSIAANLVKQFALDNFVFLPAFHAPHKPDRPPTSALHRYAMLCLATSKNDKLLVSSLELEKREKRYTIDTLSDLERGYADVERFFVMGSDSWLEIRTWREWEAVLLAVNHIIVARPGFEISSDHVTDRVRRRIIDVRSAYAGNAKPPGEERYGIYISDTVRFDISATNVRNDIIDKRLDRVDDVPLEVAKYIEKYDLYI